VTIEPLMEIVNGELVPVVVVPLEQVIQQMSAPIDIGERCTHCGDYVGWGSDKRINRIPSGHDWEVETPSGKTFSIPVDGWMCAECAAYDCDVCNDPIPLDEDIYVEHPTLYCMHVHEECLPDEWKEYTND